MSQGSPPRMKIAGLFSREYQPVIRAVWRESRQRSHARGKSTQQRRQSMARDTGGSFRRPAQCARL